MSNPYPPRMAQTPISNSSPVTRNPRATIPSINSLLAAGYQQPGYGQPAYVQPDSGPTANQ